MWMLYDVFYLGFSCIVPIETGNVAAIRDCSATIDTIDTWALVWKGQWDSNIEYGNATSEKSDVEIDNSRIRSISILMVRVVFPKLHLRS